MARPTALLPLLAVAAAIRIAVNNVVAFSRADESVYLLYARALSNGDGYPKIIRMFVDDPGMWVFPNPLRWSYLGVASLFSSSHEGLAMLSTIAGILAVGLTYWIARELFDERIALVATALVATSPLQLALGRRALADEFFCAAALASIGALLLYARTKRLTWLAIWIAATTVAMAAKEQILFIYPVVLLFWWLRTRELHWAWLLPPFLFYAVFCVLARDLTSFFQIARIITSAMTAPYAEQYQSGPAHRLIIDSLAIAPLVTAVSLAALVTIALRRSGFAPAMRHLTVLVSGILVVHAMLPSQNLRYIVSADPLLRILVAGFVMSEERLNRGLVIALVANAAVELMLFHRVFIAAQVYDPVTDNLLRALRMLPR
jgi:4-amino-4-deoxy-L-arabinose transferase-like glycosyltransferase